MKDSHQCRDGLLMNKCPVCWEMLFNSTWPTSVLNCGHAIHKKCLEVHLVLICNPQMYVKNQNMNCPICFKPLYDLKAIRDQQGSQLSMLKLTKIVAMLRMRLRQNFPKLVFFIFVVLLLLYRLFLR